MEKEELNFKVEYYKAPAVTISTTISPDFHRRAKEHGISWAEAMRVGLSIMFAELGEIEYDNRLNLYKKMKLYQQQAEENSKKYFDLKEELEKRDKQIGIHQT